MLYKDISEKNEFSTWLIEPEKFTFMERLKNENYSAGKPYDVVIGIMPTGEEKIQGYKYQTRFWTKNQAKKHCTENKGINFVTANIRKKYTDFRKIPDKIKKFPKNAQILWLFSYNENFGKNLSTGKAEEFAKKIVMFFFEKINNIVILKKEFENKPIEYFLSRMKGFANE